MACAAAASSSNASYEYEDLSGEEGRVFVGDVVLAMWSETLVDRGRGKRRVVVEPPVV